MSQPTAILQILKITSKLEIQPLDQIVVNQPVVIIKDEHVPEFIRNSFAYFKHIVDWQPCTLRLVWVVVVSVIEGERSSGCLAIIRVR